MSQAALLLSVAHYTISVVCFLHSGRGIVVLRTLRVRVTRVRFSAARHDTSPVSFAPGGAYAPPGALYPPPPFCARTLGILKAFSVYGR